MVCPSNSEGWGNSAYEWSITTAFWKIRMNVARGK